MGKSTGRKKAARRKRPSAKRGFQGLVLSARQVWLGGSAAALLLLLTFFLGLAMGRGDDSDTPSTQLRKDTPPQYVMVQADFSLRRPSGKAMTRREVAHELTQKFGVPAKAIIDIRAEGDRMVVELGPFRSADSANEYLEKWGLPAAHLNLEAPFRFHDVVKYQPRR